MGGSALPCRNFYTLHSMPPHIKPPKRRKTRPPPPTERRPRLPCEVVDIIIGNIDDDLEALKAAIALRRIQQVDTLIPKIHNLLDSASANGLVEILEWWKASGLPLKYTCLTMDRASRNGHVEVMAWWKESGIYVKYSFDAMN